MPHPLQDNEKYLLTLPSDAPGPARCAPPSSPGNGSRLEYHIARPTPSAGEKRHIVELRRSGPSRNPARSPLPPPRDDGPATPLPASAQRHNPPSPNRGADRSCRYISPDNAAPRPAGLPGFRYRPKGDKTSQLLLFQHAV